MQTTKEADWTKRYPVLFACTHCSQRGVTRKMGIRSATKKWLTCPSCRYGSLERMHWNGFRWC